MSEIVRTSEDLVARPVPVANAATPTITVQEALAAIRQDSHAAPATYLGDTVVPHGGE
jgi:hypothetical protein